MWRTFGAGQILQADHSIIGILSPTQIARFGFDLEAYEPINISQEEKYASLFTMVRWTNGIILEYAPQNLVPLTLRQIHYQLVVRHKTYINTKLSYDHFTQDLANSRLWGLTPWDAIEDPTRDVHEWHNDESVESALRLAAAGHHLDHWKNQRYAPIVLVEKDAALSIVARAADVYFVPYVSLKGYGSLSVLRNGVGKYCLAALDCDRTPVVIHLSDHDATGWDMVRNLKKYLMMFVHRPVDVRHIALTPAQIIAGYGDGYPLPSDPVKTKDPRSGKYIQSLPESGLEEGAWELDALAPDVLQNIIVNEINSLIDPVAWAKVEAEENEQRAIIVEVANEHGPRIPSERCLEGLRATRELLAEA